MKIESTPIEGLFLVTPKRFEDERGFFTNVFCSATFRNEGLVDQFDQSSVSFNFKAGTLRGMHFQVEPCEQTKLVRCTMGSVFDVAIDLRPDSKTYMQWHGAELTDDNRSMLYIPAGCAHGYLTLSDGAEVCYQIAGEYRPDLAGGVRWNDPAFGVKWPIEPTIVNERDNTYPLYQKQTGLPPQRTSAI